MLKFLPRPALLILLSCVFLNACSSETTPKQDATSPSADQTPKPGSSSKNVVVAANMGNFSPDLAMEELFGNYDEASASSTWPKEGHSDASKAAWKRVSSFHTDGMNFSSKVVKHFTYTVQDNEFLFLVTEVNDNSSNMESEANCGVLGVHHFGKTKQGWICDVKLPIALCKGTFGEVKVPELVQIGPEKYALACSFGRTSFGETQEDQEWFVLNHDSLQSVLSFTSGRNTAGMEGEEEPTKWSTTYQIDQKSGGTYCDITITKSGTEPGKDWGLSKPIQMTLAQKVDESILYKYSGGKYIAVE